MKLRHVIIIICIGIMLLIAAAIRFLLTRDLEGSISLEFPEERFFMFRIVPIVAAFIVGGGLGVSGMGLQVLLRNPLASPWILGLSSGAGLGVMGNLYLEHSYGYSFLGSQSVGALVGAIGALTLVYLLSRKRGGIDPMTMVLVGVVVSVLFGAGIMLLQHTVPMGLRGSFTTWLMGSLPQVESWWRLSILGCITLVGIGFVAWWGPTLDAACLSDDEATSVGVNLPRIRQKLFVISSLLAAIGVILAGPIAFVGLIAPHGSRLLVGGSHRVLAIVTAMSGALLLVCADDIRQLVDVGTGRLPIGIITSVFGGIVFLVLLLRARGKV
jgi:iron complex transport system permease protein